MAYPENLLIAMRQDLTQYGVGETRTPADVDAAIHASGSTLMVVNSVCGCAAGKARPAVGMALHHPIRPERAVTVFAGGDDAAVAHLRATHLAGLPSSSPSMGLFRDGKLVWWLHRHEIESRQAPEIAQLLTRAFEEYCAPKSA
jgi:putative YphP/YqiW family bacilliredoxin